MACRGVPAPRQSVLSVARPEPLGGWMSASPTSVTLPNSAAPVFAPVAHMRPKSSRAKAITTPEPPISLATTI